MIFGYHKVEARVRPNRVLRFYYSNVLYAVRILRDLSIIHTWFLLVKFDIFFSKLFTLIYTIFYKIISRLILTLAPFFPLKK